MRLLTLILVLLALVTRTLAQAETPTVVPIATTTATNMPDTYLDFEMSVLGTPQPARFALEATAGDVHIANLLTGMLFTMWSVISFAVFVVWRDKWRS